LGSGKGALYPSLQKGRKGPRHLSLSNGHPSERKKEGISWDLRHEKKKKRKVHDVPPSEKKKEKEIPPYLREKRGRKCRP